MIRLNNFPGFISNLSDPSQTALAIELCNVPEGSVDKHQGQAADHCYSSLFCMKDHELELWVSAEFPCCVFVAKKKKYSVLLFYPSINAKVSDSELGTRCHGGRMV